MIQTKLIKLTICPCGTPMTLPHIKVGDAFSIDESRQGMVNFTCGGCGKDHLDLRVAWGFVNERGEGPGYLVLDLFDMTPSATVLSA